MQNLRHRFSDASWYGYPHPILVGGSGGIGTWFTMMASRAGYDIYLFDYDIVEELNLGGQLFNIKQIGKPKVEAIAETCKEFSDHAINTFNEKYTMESMSNHIMIGCFDNMEARKVFYKKWKTHVSELPEEDKSRCILIDGRLEAETWQIYCVTIDTMEMYEREGLFDDSEVEDTEASCTFKQTSHIAAMLGSVMLNFLNSFVTNVKIERKLRKIPFFTQYAAAINLYKSRNHELTPDIQPELDGQVST